MTTCCCPSYAQWILAYEADPVTDECYHAIASHRLVDLSVDPTDEEKMGICG
jgi:hypothetical protein